MKKPHHLHLLDQEKAESAVGGPVVFEELRRLWGLKSAHDAKGFHFYDVAEIQAAVERRDLEAAH